MLNSAEQLSKEILHSLPIPVRFFGFDSDTLKLAAAGWGLSMRQMTLAHWGGMELQLAMQIGEKGSNAMYALSAPIQVEVGRLHSALANRHAYVEFLAHLGFEIQYMAPNFQFRIIPTVSRTGVNAFLNSWEPIDAIPQIRDEEINMADFKFFKVANPKLQDIIVSPEQVPELMNMVLKAQEISLKSIRAREKSRENLQRFREDMMDVKPARNVQAQIITLCA
jgi:hypothetical protein